MTDPNRDRPPSPLVRATDRMAPLIKWTALAGLALMVVAGVLILIGVIVRAA